MMYSIGFTYRRSQPFTYAQPTTKNNTVRIAKNKSNIASFL